VQRSVRLRSSASAYFNRTPAGAGSLTTWTWSSWVKRGKLGARQFIFSSGVSPTTTQVWQCEFNASDKIEFYNQTIGTYRLSTQVFRDPSAWYHIVFCADTNNGTAQSRFRCWVNGIEITTWDTNSTISSGYSFALNGAYRHTIGEYSYTLGSGLSLDGYLTEVNFVDGQALTPTSFGSINSSTGVWQPVKYSGTYGTNGFYLNFQDNSGATATTIGKDSSGNGNNWTPNGISVTAGVTYDSMLDVPTLTGANNANFATFNPVDKGTSTASQGNLAITGAGSWGFIKSTFPLDQGKWYWEVVMTAAANNAQLGIAVLNRTTPADLAGVNAIAVNGAGLKYVESSTGVSGFTTFTVNDIISFTFDSTTGNLNYAKNGGSYSLITTVSIVDGRSWSPAASVFATGDTTVINFGQRPFSYTPPAGFKSLNTFNLPDSTIPSGATQFAATLYTGTGSALSVSNAVNGKSFQPDLVWIKGRSAAYQHALFDSIRAARGLLISNSTGAEVVETAGTSMTSFDSSGFSLGTNGATASTNVNTSTFVAWQWKAGGTAVTNTSGSISSQVSANPSAGFSIVTYTGNGTAGATFGHGLGVAPRMVIIKDRTSGSNEWQVYHASIGNTGTLFLNTTNSTFTNIVYWNNTSPTSTTVTLGSGVRANTSTNNYVAYCFSEIAGYSKFGSYIGNGATDGPFVYTGFRPKFILVKNSIVGTDSWQIWDSSRNTYNITQNYLLPNSAAAEASGSGFFVDFTSNGFKIRNSNTASNGNTNTLIYAAFAENPFKNALAR
jgi:hypothetical protein